MQHHGRGLELVPFGTGRGREARGPLPVEPLEEPRHVAGCVQGVLGVRDDPVHRHREAPAPSHRQVHRLVAGIVAEVEEQGLRRGRLQPAPERRRLVPAARGHHLERGAAVDQGQLRPVGPQAPSHARAEGRLQAGGDPREMQRAGVDPRLQPRAREALAPPFEIPQERHRQRERGAGVGLPMPVLVPGLQSGGPGVEHAFDRDPAPQVVEHPARQDRDVRPGLPGKALDHRARARRQLRRARIRSDGREGPVEVEAHV